ncbi:MAG TPA: AAA family ATPase [Bacteroidia bacterium]|nr:AAA family ATPase [Bacteroidia bacterium]
MSISCKQFFENPENLGRFFRFSGKEEYLFAAILNNETDLELFIRNFNGLAERLSIEGAMKETIINQLITRKFYGYGSFKSNLQKGLPSYLTLTTSKARYLEIRSEIKPDGNINTEFTMQYVIPLEKRIDIQSKVTINYSNPKIEMENKMRLPKTEFALNTILFGPPGTGKTYHTIHRALEIINPDFNFDIGREVIKEEYDRLVSEGQIVFTTFHQSMSYEDFIEGIKPLHPKSEGDPVVYKVVDGIFKNISLEASKTKQKNVRVNEHTLEINEEMFEDFYKQFVETLIGAENEESNTILKTQEGYEFGLYKNSSNSITIKSGKKKTKMSASLNELKAVFFHNKPPTYKSYENLIINKILENTDFVELESENSSKNFVLIIDEINRGNVSQIFGELITLIEEDKRFGKTEAIEVVLPYSKEKFSVPPNLYIIGTMNTADRSVEALDTALRRRFNFVEMPPKSDLITPFEILRSFWIKNTGLYGGKIESYNSYENELRDFLGLTILDEEKYLRYGESSDSILSKNEFSKNLNGVIEFNGINLSKILDTINLRIEKLVGRDHQIGHSYFMNVYSLSKLKLVFQNNVIPLLQEYFYGDYGKIGLVLGEHFFSKIDDKEMKNIFAQFGEYDGLSLAEKPSYVLKNVVKMKNLEFKDALEKLIQVGN